MQFAAALSSYGWIPPGVTTVFIFLLVALEILFGALIICGLFMKKVVFATAGLFAVYTVVLVVALLTGHTSHSCGCFSGVATGNGLAHFVTGGSTITESDVVRDVLLIAITLGIYWQHVPQASLDGVWQRYNAEDAAKHRNRTVGAAKPAHRQALQQKKQGRNQYAKTSAPRQTPFTETRVEWLLKRFNLLLAIFVISAGSIVFGTVAILNLESTTKNDPLINATDFHPQHTNLRLNSTAPDFSLNTLDGKAISLRAERGHIVLLEFFAVWCPYCQEEAPILDTLDKHYRSAKFEALSVVANPYGKAYEASNFTDFSTYTSKDVLWFMNTYHVKHPILIDPNFTVTNEYGVTGYPLLYIIDKHGVIRNVFEGPTPVVQLEKVIQSLL